MAKFFAFTFIFLRMSLNSIRQVFLGIKKGCMVPVLGVGKNRGGEEDRFFYSVGKKREETNTSLKDKLIKDVTGRKLSGREIWIRRIYE